MSRRAWTPRQVARLRALAGLFPLKEVARLMRRSYSSVKNATCKLGIDCGRAWTPGQLARLRADYGKLPARHLALVLGRPLPAVCRMARKLGLSRTASRFTAEDLARIRELNGQGWSDTEIAHALGRDRHETTKHRKRLHLPSQQHGHRVRARLAAALQRQLERLGLHSAAKGVVVVLVLVAGQDAVDAGADHLQERVVGQVRVAGVIEGLSKGPGQADALVELADGEQSGVTGELARRRLDNDRRAEVVQDLWPGRW
jgi:hypothetical protein